MENKKVKYTMINTVGEEVEVVFELKPLPTRWEYTEIVSAVQNEAKGDIFKLSFGLAKKLFPRMVVSPAFPVKKTMNGIEWTIDTQIKEFFINDPEAMQSVVFDLMGLMKAPRTKEEE